MRRAGKRSLDLPTPDDIEDLDTQVNQGEDFLENDVLRAYDAEVRHFQVISGGRRLDVWLAEASELSRSQTQRLIRAGRVTLDGEIASPRSLVREGQKIVLALEPVQEADLLPEEIPLQIVHQDADIVVINKQRGLVVHPAAGHATGTLVQALLYHCPDLQAIAGTIRPGIVHRLDKDTTGLLVAAKSEQAMQQLSQQIKERNMERFYLALVWGGFKEDHGSIDLPIARHPQDRKRMAVVADGRPARTEYHVMERFGQWTLLGLKLHSGRTHQIRVHLSHRGHPIVGDPLYGPRPNPFGLVAQALHAHRLCLNHPRDSSWCCWEAPLPDDFADALASLRTKFT